jgi:AcrR family transcriptional regulator
MARPSRRTELLDAAVAVVRRDGAAALTLDAVAAEAGVSKGGVLYHFASKRALIDGLLERWLDDFEARLDAGGDAFTAYVRACDLSAADPDRTASEFGLLAGMIEEPRVLEATRERQAGWMERMLAGAADPVDAWLVRLAADGLWYSDLLGIAPPQGEDRRRLIERLVALGAGDAR